MPEAHKPDITKLVESSTLFKSRGEELGFNQDCQERTATLLAAQISMVEEELLKLEGYDPGLLPSGRHNLALCYTKFAEEGLVTFTRAEILFQDDKQGLAGLAKNIYSEHHPDLSNSSKSKASGDVDPLIGYVAPEGDPNAGYTYAGRDENGPLWVSPYAPRNMNHDEASAWATEQGGSLPTKQEGKHLDGVKDKGALRALFNHSGSDPDGCIWLAEINTFNKDYAWFQDLSNGYQGNHYLSNYKLPVLCVRR